MKIGRAEFRKIAVVCSKKDIAGMNIRRKLLESSRELDIKFQDNSVYEIKEDVLLYTLNTETIYTENIDEEIDADLFIFATRHKSKSEIPSLSVHVPGNWSIAEAGGWDNKLCVGSSSLMWFSLLKLKDYSRDLDYEVVQEVTHHGPFLKKPVMFIEIGSNEKRWNDKRAVDVISKVLFDLFCLKIEERKTAFGIGGLHTMPNLERYAEKNDVSFCHVCPKYMLDSLDKGLIKEAMDKSIEECDLIVLDWKGLKDNKKRIVDMLNELGLEYERTR
ncbi:MAG: D-aminoacyl-tRNA deacylase [Halobacteriota archaeon]|nr:D-aminoacyl-tRNA deacylase [Halobacteriota archaeon]